MCYCDMWVCDSHTWNQGYTFLEMLLPLISHLRRDICVEIPKVCQRAREMALRARVFAAAPDKLSQPSVPGVGRENQILKVLL